MKNETSQLVPMVPVNQPAQAMELSSSREIAGMLKTVISSGLKGENVQVMEKMLDLYERLEKRDGEKEFAKAFSALQSEMPKIKAMKPVPDRDGKVKYCFAPFEEIMDQVRPLLQKHGFTVSFSAKYIESRIVRICHLHHVGGHQRDNEFAVRIGKGPPNASESQADGAAGTYAKRFALCDALNIVIETDNDAKLEGDVIGENEARNLQIRVTSCGMNEATFLRLAQAATYAEIRESAMPTLLEMIKLKEHKG